MTMPLDQLMDDEWQAQLKADPFLATSLGERDFNHLLPEMSESAFAERLTELREFKARWQKIKADDLSEEDRLNYDLFGIMLDNKIGEIEFYEYRMPIDKTNGFHAYAPYYFATQLPAKTVDDYENLIARLEALPQYVAGAIEVMRAGLDYGQIPSNVTQDGVVEQMQAQILDDPTASLFFQPFTKIPKTIGEQDQSRLAKAGEAAVRQAVIPAYKALSAFYQQEYAPKVKSEIGAANLPDGLTYYQFCLKRETTLDLTAEEIHQIGLEEVARIRAEMDEAIVVSGFDGGRQAFVEYLRSDPKFYPETAEQFLKEAAYIVKKMEGQLPALFKTLPRMTYGVVPMPEEVAPGNTTARYSPPSMDGTRAGEYWVNTYDLKSRPLYELEALSLHEAVPGHHLQIALQFELGDLPNFRRYGFFNAYIEGWALYSERLGLETGFYQDPYSNFGRLSFEMWRACRLVVDPGMHALGWTRQQAIDFMADNTALTMLNIQSEVDRYISWPGQAVSYKIGEIKIRELRAKAEQALGSQFDVREFHDRILLSGPIPLSVLEQRITDWIAEQQRK